MKNEQMQAFVKDVLDTLESISEEISILEEVASSKLACLKDELSE